MFSQRNLRYLYKYLILRFVRPPSAVPATSEQQSLVTRRNKYPVASNMLISIDGNISSGKSSLVSKLVEHFSPLAAHGASSQNGHSHNHDHRDSNAPVTNGHGVGSFELEVIPEPLDKWCNMKGFNLLELFYKEPKKYNFLFQHYVQLTRLMDTVKSSANATSNLPKIRLMERSLQNNRYCFLELARKSGQLQSAEFSVLAEWHSWLEANMDLELDVVIYLRTSPEVAYSRMLNRGRAEESSCPLSYLVDLHESYEDWLIRGKISQSSGLTKRQHVIVIDANQSKEKVVADSVEQLMDYLDFGSKKSINGVHSAERNKGDEIRN